MKAVVLASVLFIFSFMVSCSSGDSSAAESSQAVNKREPIEITKNISADPPGEILPQSKIIPQSEPESYTFPLSEKPRKIGLIQSFSYTELMKAVKLYFKVYGQHTESLDSFINSGIPIMWPRNAIDGKPISIFKGKELSAGFENYGVLHYVKDKSGYAQMKYLYLKRGINTDGYDDTWEINTTAFPSMNIPNIPKIAGFDVDISSVNDPQTRELLAMFGQLMSLIVRRTGEMFYDLDIFPSSVETAAKSPRTIRFSPEASVISVPQSAKDPKKSGPSLRRNSTDCWPPSIGGNSLAL